MARPLAVREHPVHGESDPTVRHAVLPEQRRELMLRAVDADAGAGVGELARRFGVSEMTVRRDLTRLDREGKLRRVRGGALSERGEPPFAQTATERLAAKDRVGARAAELVLDGETVIVDIGTTTLQLARHLRGRELTVMTSNLAVYEELVHDASVELVLLGGLVRRNYSSLVGPLTEEALSQVSADRAFLGASGVRADGSFTDTTMVEVPIKRAMIAAARQTVMLVDSAKLGSASGVRICGPDSVDVLVTDPGAPVDRVRSLEAAGVEVILA